jgi:hypothetical protein
MADDNTTPDPTEVKPAWYWIKDTKGYGSVTVTMVFVAFWVTTLAYIVSLVEKIGGVTIRPFDVAACSAYFIPILTLYFGRKFTDAKFGTASTPGPKD